MQRDERVRAFVDPSRIVWRSAHGITNENGLLGGAGDCAMQRSEGAEPPAILLDFGEELHGGVRIESPTNSRHSPVRFRVRFGESVSEAMGEPNNDHAVHDQEALVPLMGHMEIGCTGFRFVRIDLLDEDVSIALSAIKAVALYRDLAYLGSFECDDDRLNEIWKVGAKTVHLCLQDHVWDGIKRDRLVWIGDIHPEMRVVSSVFGQLDVVEKSLDYARDTYALPEWINGISSYSIWWILAHHDWYLWHGNFEYLCTQREYLLRLLDQLAQHVNAEGHECLGGHRFLDWPTADDPTAIAAGLQALMVLGFRAGAELCRALGEEDAARRAASLAEALASFEGAVSERKQVCALTALAGMIDPSDANQSILSVDPYRGMSTFYGYYVLEARAKAGDYLGCLGLIRNYWGGMLDLGATTFWEHFELDWAQGAGRIDEIVAPGMHDIHVEYGDYCYKSLRHSFCHGWAAGPTAWLSEHVLGVSPVSPGFESVAVNPHLGNLRWVRGTVPTPHGLIEISHQVDAGGEIHTEIAAPDSIRVLKTIEQIDGACVH